MAIDVRASLKRALKSLHSDRARIDRQITAITTALGELGGVAGRAASAAAGRKGDRTRSMSAAQKKAVSVRMKAYWAKRRAGK